jgi:four helix bundle protein
MSKQLFRSGTSIGSNIAEGTYAQSEADFISKLSIALKEASESIFWIELLHESKYITAEEYDSIHSDCIELIKLLTKSVKTVKNKIGITVTNSQE